MLTLTTTHRPATDLGYLLHKHPDRAQRFDLPFGSALHYYPEATEARCTAVLELEIDPVALTRRSRRGGGFALQPYVNDRPYVASSFLSVAIARVYRSAINGKCADRPELVDRSLPLVARLPVLPARDGAAGIRALFEPLGYRIETRRLPLDERFPEWGPSRYHAVELAHEIPLKELLAHLYVLIPVLDDEKHYWVGSDEIEKLLARGAGWLATHPAREMITRRYLKRQRSLTDEALALLQEEAPVDDVGDEGEQVLEARLGLHTIRLQTVRDVIRESGARRVLDLGCGEGKLLRLLLEERQLTEIVGMDVSARELARAAERLPDDPRLTLIQGSLLYRDARLAGFDAAALVEVIEHVAPARLPTLERVLFGEARPQTVVVTTPNREYNPQWPSLPAGALRHPDHRFEWDRAEFIAWAGGVAERYGYTVATRQVGPEVDGVGAATQMGLFTR